MNISKRKGWNYLFELSKKEKDSRKVAMIRAYSWVEHALKAFEYNQSKGSIAKRLLLAKSDGLLNNALTEKKLRMAINSRHLAAHADTVQDEFNCLSVVKIFNSIWIDLKNKFVNLGNAKKIANEIISIDGVLNVSLFGSLSRKGGSPNDIDILVFDDGRYSEMINDNQVKYNDPVKRTLFCKEILEINSSCNDEIIKCRWLDISIIDGKKMGLDVDYTKSMVDLQPDPYFYLNISEDLLDYNKTDNNFYTSKISFFNELRKIKQSYKNLIDF